MAGTQFVISGYLKNIIPVFKKAGIRVSIFVDPVVAMVDAALETGTQRIELYTEGYAKKYHEDKQLAVQPYLESGNKSKRNRIGINAGHDLDLENLRYFAEQIPWIDEVSIGHALISDALYLGYENAVQLYKRQLQ